MFRLEMDNQANQICVGCWGGAREEAGKPNKLVGQPSTGRESREKKLSLRKPNKSSQKISDMGSPITSEKTWTEKDPQTYRIFPNQQTNRPPSNDSRQSRFPIAPRSQYNLSRWQTCRQPQPERRFHQIQQYAYPTTKRIFEPSLKLIDHRLNMVETTKFSRIPQFPSEELKKTRKTVIFSKPGKTLRQINNMKESVCSISDGSQLEERMQESLILMDYFNPEEARKEDLQKYMEAREKKEFQSMVFSRP